MTRKALIDLNVVLDVLLDREPHAHASSRLLTAIEDGRVAGCFSAASVDTLHYLLSSHMNAARSGALVREVVSLLTIAPVDQQVVDWALASGWKDLEDAIVCESGRAAGATVIVTRNARDFRRAKLVVMSPEELLAALAQSQS